MVRSSLLAMESHGAERGGLASHKDLMPPQWKPGFTYVRFKQYLSTADNVIAKVLLLILPMVSNSVIIVNLCLKDCEAKTNSYVFTFEI